MTRKFEPVPRRKQNTGHGSDAGTPEGLSPGHQASAGAAGQSQWPGEPNLLREVLEDWEQVRSRLLALLGPEKFRKFVE